MLSGTKAQRHSTPSHSLSQRGGEKLPCLISASPLLSAGSSSASCRADLATPHLGQGAHIGGRPAQDPAHPDGPLLSAGSSLAEFLTSTLPSLTSGGGLQVAAFTSGRRRVSRFDCLLLQHVLWQRPAEGPRIGDYILQQLGAEDDLQQAEYLFQGAPGVLCVLCQCRRQRCDRLQGLVTCPSHRSL